MTSKPRLRVLVVDDTEDDFQLVLRYLRRLDFQIEAVRVDTAESMQRALAREPWDVVLSDWSMPSFTAPAALEKLREAHLDLPFIIVSGTVGEETAVEAMRNGAHDFILKDRLARLGVAIERELREAQLRRERVSMQEQLMMSDRMATMGILAAGVAHEINNPLAAVLANLELALDDIADPSRVSREALLEEVRDARVAAERVRHIVRDLRIFSRSESETRGHVDVVQVMESTLRMASNELRHRARVIKQYEHVPPVLASEPRLGQVFLNLIINAAQALPEGKADRNQVRVAIGRAGDRVRIEIADTGPGIPPEIMPRLFTPFVTTKPVGIGTGLGLSICHRIVAALDGEIRVDSRPEQGTRFTILLPPAGDVPAADAAPETPQVPPARRRGTILLVDDDALVSRTLQRSLEGEHDITVAHGGRDALELVSRGNRFDVIVCDLMMPEVSGMDVYEEIVRVAPDQATRIVFLTGGAFTPGAQAFVKRIDNVCLEKPFDAAQVRALVNERVR